MISTHRFGILTASGVRRVFGWLVWTGVPHTSSVPWDPVSESRRQFSSSYTRWFSKSTTRNGRTWPFARVRILQGRPEARKGAETSQACGAGVNWRYRCMLCSAIETEIDCSIVFVNCSSCFLWLELSNPAGFPEQSSLKTHLQLESVWPPACR